MPFLAQVTLLVPDYDEGIAFFTGALAFQLLEDTDLGGGKRWVRVGPPTEQSKTTGILLACGTTPEQKAAIGKQGGGRVWLFLETTDFATDYARMKEAGVTFLEAPRHEPYGMVPW